ncbi:MFS transporter [Paenibacillus thalictri]|uniref:MFS transporter n=1 Tax=Paenibacillus thalictri TaxID=2527873 RepID=A0A4Q9DFG0_9BACL|nr:MFS transporter [Paenibacillus thalictri]TBL70763.1 MFS transporter [Paenibacillus thalictri]
MNVLGAGERLIQNHFHALTHKNYRYFWLGQCVSLVGTWMQNIGQSWLVLTMTGSPFLLGLVGTVQFLPVTCFSLFAGTIIDKFPKKTVLLITQTAFMLLAFILSALVFTGTVQYGYILVMAFLLGTINAFDLPTRQSFNIEVVGKEDLLNAVALNSMTFNLARIVGPAIGAGMMAYFGAAWCFLLNGLSFIAVIYGLLQIKPVAYVRKKKANTGVFKEIKDGFLYIARDPLLAKTILLVAVIGTFGFNFAVLIPVFTKSVLHMQEKTYGVLMSCLGVGSLIGALAMSVRSKQGPKLALIVSGAYLISVFLIGNGLNNVLWLTGLLLALNGLCNILFSTNCNSTLQLNTKDEYRSRVMSIYTLVFAGSTPLGNLFAGIAADRFGADGAFVACGSLCLILISVILLVYRHKDRDMNKQDALAT